MAQTFPLIEVQGSPQELGREHGAQAREQIRGFLDYLAASLNITRDSLHERALRFLPLFEKFCPQLVPEIRGLSEGAQIEFAEALAVQIRGELGGLPEHACTTFAVSPAGTASGELLIGQTSDMPAEMLDYCYVLRVHPDDRPAAVMWTFGGMLGYHGLNAHGVAHFANSLGGGPAWKFALPHYPLKRLMLEQSTLQEVRSLFKRVPVCSNGNYMLCDGSGKILDVELTGLGPHYLEEEQHGFLAHSNHFLCAPHDCSENIDQSLPDSIPRLQTMRELISAKYGEITLQDCQEFLSNHAGYPVSICRHPQTDGGYGDAILPASGHTVAGLIAEPARGILHVCRGNPCQEEFVAYCVN